MNKFTATSRLRVYQFRHPGMLMNSQDPYYISQSAEKRTRTSIPARGHAPETCASTSFAISADQIITTLDYMKYSKKKPALLIKEKDSAACLSKVFAV
jgi:hypothetical protein